MQTDQLYSPSSTFAGEQKSKFNVLRRFHCSIIDYDWKKGEFLIKFVFEKDADSFVA